MFKTTKTCVWMIAAGAAVLLAPISFADDRGAAEILKDIDAVTMPTYDGTRGSDVAYRNEYFRLRNEASKKKADFIGELFKADPKNDRLIQLLPERWSYLVGNDTSELFAEVKSITSTHPDGPLATEADFWNAQAAQRAYGWVEEPQYDKVASAINAFVDKYPDDPRSISLMSNLAGYFSPDQKEALKIWKTLLAKYPDNRSAKYWPGKIKQSDGIGKPFELEFTDAIKGSEISMADLRGKVVVIDFWATWCGPCIAEMPHMKELYAQYKNKGVEFLGISLDQPEDQGGLEKLRKYCDENDIIWPQYYQGNYWSSEYSVSWGINSIPAMFIVDQNGHLYSTSARGQLDKMLPELLSKTAAVGGGG